MNPFSVDGDLHLVRVSEAADVADIRAPELRLDDVVAIEGKRLMNQDATPRPERKPLDVLGLSDVQSYSIGLVGRSSGRIADGQRADSLRRGQVALQQRWGHSQD